MRRFVATVFDEWVYALSTYTSDMFQELLGSCDQLSIQAITDAVTGGGVRLSVTIETTADGMRWSEFSPVISGASLTSAQTNVAVGVDDGANLKMGRVRLRIELAGTSPQARVRLIACGRDTTRARGALNDARAISGTVPWVAAEAGPRFAPWLSPPEEHATPSRFFFKDTKREFAMRAATRANAPDADHGCSCDTPSSVDQSKEGCDCKATLPPRSSATTGGGVGLRAAGTTPNRPSLLDGSQLSTANESTSRLLLPGVRQLESELIATLLPSLSANADQGILDPTTFDIGLVLKQFPQVYPMASAGFGPVFEPPWHEVISHLNCLMTCGAGGGLPFPWSLFHECCLIDGTYKCVNTMANDSHCGGCVGPSGTGTNCLMVEGFSCLDGECAASCTKSDDCLLPFAFCRQGVFGGQGCDIVECTATGNSACEDIHPHLGCCDVDPFNPDTPAFCKDMWSLKDCGACHTPPVSVSTGPPGTIAAGCCEDLTDPSVPPFPEYARNVASLNYGWCACMDPMNSQRRMIVVSSDSGFWWQCPCAAVGQKCDKTIPAHCCTGSGVCKGPDQDEGVCTLL